MNDFDLILTDIKQALEKIDYNFYIYNSIINHLTNECTEEEIAMIYNMIYDLKPSTYETEEAFINDYGVIFDTVDFPLKDAFRIMNKRKLNYEEL